MPGQKGFVRSGGSAVATVARPALGRLVTHLIIMISRQNKLSGGFRPFRMATGNYTPGSTYGLVVVSKTRSARLLLKDLFEVSQIGWELSRTWIPIHCIRWALRSEIDLFHRLRAHFRRGLAAKRCRHPTPLRDNSIATARRVVHDRRHRH